MTRLYEQIIIAVDHSSEASYAFQTALGIASRNIGSTLHIVHVMDSSVLSPLNSGMETTTLERVQREADELLARFERQAEDYGLQFVRTVAEIGSPKNFIVKEYAKEIQADLIICGATGKSGLQRMFVGSVSEAIVRSATCDVLVIRTPEHLWET
ncbi:universal stress protein [Caryophanon latum]|uniref:Universal stress protein n=1 Tax=Caryophanon latum TaxID=33977 RepID=A0A1C0YT45_9BACL|nr:universal stress protein [Caryophanon latum]OCS90309.1 hypothetical protein A6K76_11945 [Caryophanon latum]